MFGAPARNNVYDIKIGTTISRRLVTVIVPAIVVEFCRWIPRRLLSAPGSRLRGRSAARAEVFNFRQDHERPLRLRVGELPMGNEELLNVVSGTDDSPGLGKDLENANPSARKRASRIPRRCCGPICLHTAVGMLGPAGWRHRAPNDFSHAFEQRNTPVHYSEGSHFSPKNGLRFTSVRLCRGLVTSS